MTELKMNLHCAAVKRAFAIFLAICLCFTSVGLNVNAAVGGGDSPSKTAATSDGPGETPDGPEETPDGPEETPDGPEETPDGPEETPDGPEETPDGPEETPDGPEDILATGVTLNKLSLALNVGTKTTLTATVAPTTATDKAVTWNSSDATTVSVDSNGVVTAIKNGTAKITATTANGKVSAPCTVTVTTPAIVATGVTLNKSNLALNAGTKATLTATVAPATATDKKVTWKSSDATIASVDSNGTVTAIKDGTAKITATTANGKVSAPCTVTVTTAVTKVSLTKTITVIKGKSKVLKATVAPSTASNKKITWSSSNSKVVTVDKNGKITGKKAGIATITAKASNGVKATCKVTVAELKLNASTIAVQLKKSTTALKVISKYPTKDSVTYKSSNTKIATVDKNGKITGKKIGTATITVTSKSGATATCKVTVQKGKVVTKSLKMSSTKATLLKGKKLSLTVTRNPISATEKITWTTSNKKVATVDKNGKVTAKAAGTATITAKSSNGKKATSKITVADLKLNASTISVQVKKSTTALKVISKYPTKDSVTYKSSNTKVATVDKKGKITGKKTGTATITVTSKSGAKATCKVTVLKGKVVTKSLKISKTKATLSKGKKLSLTVTRNPISATEKITWTTSNKKVAIVDKNGKVTAKAAGKVTITAKSSNGKKATCKITVSAKK